MGLTLSPPETAPARPVRRESGKAVPPLVSRTVVTGLLMLAAAYALFPLTYLVIGSSKHKDDLFTTDAFEVTRLGLWENLSLLFTQDDGIFLRWMANSFLYAAAGALLGTLVSIVTGYIFDKYDFPLKEKVFGMVLLAVLIPSAATILPFYLLASKFGLVNSVWGMILPAMVSPFGVYISRVYSAAYVPNEVVEAARMDGATELQILLRVGLPMLRTAFVTLFLLLFTGAWNNFFGALMLLTDKELFPASLGLFMWTGFREAHPEYYVLVLIGSLVSVIPLIVIFLALQKHFKAGLTTGALK